MSILKDFRDFLGKGSAIDLAVGLILGSAITTILKAFVDELAMPLTGLIGKVDFSNSYLVLRGSIPEGLPIAEARKVPGAVVLGYGAFATVFINTLVLAFVVFILVRAITRMRERVLKAEAAAPAPPAPELVVLKEIRDLLKRPPAG